MTTHISDKAKALLALQVQLDNANKTVRLELQQHLYQLGQLREAIIKRDEVEALLAQLIRAIAAQR